jgi:hypothetical protein
MLKAARDNMCLFRTCSIFVHQLFTHHTSHKILVLTVLFRFLRSVAYRQFTRLVYGKLGKLRIPLPSCVYQAIRTQFKSEKTFTGFEENSSDSE